MEPTQAQETLGYPQNQPQGLRKERRASGPLFLPFTRAIGIGVMEPDGHPIKAAAPAP